MTEKQPRPLAAVVPALLLVGSGFAALVYQVVWTRELTYLFGATLYAVVTVFSAFMGGLALGAWWWGKRADKMRRPIRTYGCLEMGIGITALIFPLVLRALTPLWGWGYVALEDHWTLFITMRLVVVGGLLLIPTFLMGGTVPVLLTSLTGKQGSIGGYVGWLYAANTFGAVAGAYLSGFHLIAHFGLAMTTWIAVGINACVFLIAFAVDAKVGARQKIEAPVPEPKIDEKPIAGSVTYSPGVIRLVMWLYGVSGALALAYEVLWNRGLIFCFELMKNTTYVFSAILAVYLVGLAVGSSIMSPVARRSRDPLTLFIALQFLLGVAVLVSVNQIMLQSQLIDELRFLNDEEQILWIPAVLNIFYKTLRSIGLATLIMGMLYPLANAIVIRGWGEAGRRAGQVYAFNTAGAIIGSIVAGFILLPWLGITGSLRTLGCVNILIGIVLIPAMTSISVGHRWKLAGIACLILFGGWAVMRDAKLHPLNPEETLVWYYEGRLATVSVVETPDGYRDLYVDNNGVAGTAPYILTDQKSLAHFPMLLLDEPRSALTVGFGSGGCSYSYSLYDEIEEIHCVEITEDVLTADEYLTESNLGYTLNLEQVSPHRWIKPDDPRYMLIIDDARSYIQHCGREYDIIATDCTDLRYKTNANLYDLEYFEICRDHITDDGMVVVWMPLGGLSDELFRCAVKTFYEVFPHTSIWFMNNAPTHYVLFIGTKEPQQYDLDTMQERLALNPNVVEDLEIISLEDPFKVLSCFVANEDNLDAWLEGIPLNTEDDPIIEFQAPRQGYGQVPMIENTERLLALHQSVAPLVTGMSPSEEERMALFEAAVEPIVRGLNHYRMGSEYAEASMAWEEALGINPYDASVTRLLQFEQLQRIIDGDPLTFVTEGQWEQWIVAHQWLMSVKQAQGDTDAVLVLAEHTLPPVESALAAMAATGDRDDSMLRFLDWKRMMHLRIAGLLREMGRGALASTHEQTALEVQRQMIAIARDLQAADR